MSEFKPTALSVREEKRDGEQPRIDVVAVNNQLPIASLYNYNTSERRNYAALFAAAPDLLEALQKVQEWIDRDAVGAIDPEWNYETMVGQYITAAIAEAVQS